MINNVVLVGRLTKDPDLKYTGNGTAVATFTLAVNRNFTNQSGEREADFINCVIWRKPAETLANYAKKGVLIGVTGRIQTRSYDNQQGQKVYVTEVIADNFQLLESKRADSSQNTQDGGVSNSQTTNNANVQQNRNNVQSDPFSNSSIDIDSQDLPF
ncbi:single-stranded DNA-binding protein [Enterococcus innesii]|uniref:single-stranded DNA-binding protein n=1 Tax=Enterococcus innesii TaxID=2839759 RepID=UPI002DB8D1D5|nr:single-stranded DNA-binding protein [Enterococcus innesii]MEB5950528.1 single-stranded DNA-binding protein [Enterococcus innesii]